MPRIFSAVDDDGDRLDVSVHMDGYYFTTRDSDTGTYRTVILPGEWAVTLAHEILGDRCGCGKPAAHVNADPESPDWPCRVPVPTRPIS